MAEQKPDPKASDAPTTAGADADAHPPEPVLTTPTAEVATTTPAVAPPRPMPPPLPHKRHQTRTSDIPLVRASTLVTEVRLVNTAYGLAKIAESGNQRALRTQRLPVGVSLVPYIENELICGVYSVDRDSYVALPSGEMNYPLLDTIPYFVLDDEHRRVVLGQIKKAGLNLRPPAESDLTAAVKADLATSRILWRNRPDNPFDLAAFVDKIDWIRASDQFKDVYLIRTKDNERHVLAINQLIESVIDLHVHFIRLYQPDAVRLAFRDSENVWLAPLRRSGTAG